MIPYEIGYYRPRTMGEAVSLFQTLSASGLNPCYFAGGAELIPLTRKREIMPGAFIDMKQIPECRFLGFNGQTLVVGSANTANTVIERIPFSLWKNVCHRIADHTNRNRITIGGNISGRLIYHELALPLLLTDAKLIIAGTEGMKTVSVVDFFNDGYQSNSGDLLVQAVVDRQVTENPSIFIKKTKQEKIDYPLVSVAAIYVNGDVRIAVSGLCAFPFRSNEMEKWLNHDDISMDHKINQVLKEIPGQVLSDQRGSQDYRLYVFTNVLYEVMNSFEKRD